MQTHCLILDVIAAVACHLGPSFQIKEIQIKRFIVGYFLYAEIGKPIIEFYGYADKYATFQGWYADYGAWIVGAGGFTPIPYKVITIASGVVQLNFATFFVVSVLSRGARFFIVSALLWRFGAPIRGFIEARLGLLALIFFIILFLGFVAISMAIK